MAVSPLEPQLDSLDHLPLLMDLSAGQSSNLDQSGASEIHDRQEHVIDISWGGDHSLYSVSHRPDHNSASESQDDQPSGSRQQLPTSQPSVSSSSSSAATAATSTRNGRYSRRGENYSGGGRRHRSPLNSGLWISVELVVNLSQIIAAVVVLSISRHEKPQTPLFEWIIGYTAGCVAAMPHLYWRYTHPNSQSVDRDSSVAQSNSSSNSLEVLYAPAPVSEGRNSAPASSQNEQIAATNQRLNSIVDHFKMALDCFFAVWFVVGNVWIFGGRSSATDAPNLYRLCIVFLTFSCIGYAMPFILCATICCCLPCIISILGLREDLGQNRGAAAEVINALPIYKFKMKKHRKRDVADNNADDLGEGGGVAAGTNKERLVSAEDAVCCICLARYADNDKLRELPCTHFFHMECVDKWLKINALCPLCKLEIGDTNGSSPVTSSAGNRG